MLLSAHITHYIHGYTQPENAFHCQRKYKISHKTSDSHQQCFKIMASEIITVPVPVSNVAEGISFLITFNALLV
jgi:hypothetical protein